MNPALLPQNGLAGAATAALYGKPKKKKNPLTKTATVISKPVVSN